MQPSNHVAALMSAREQKRRAIDRPLRVVLVMPPSPYLANDLAYPPMGLLYLAAAIQKFRPQHHVEVLELGGKTAWRKRVTEIEADVVGIQCVTPNYNIVKEICQILPKDIVSIVGGIHPTYLPHDCVADMPCDIVVQGEAEFILLRILDDIQKGSWQTLYTAEPIVNLDDLPMPAIELVDMNKYQPGGDRAFTIYTSRGCIFKCQFCSMVTGKIFRSHSLTRIAKEVERVRDVYGINHIVFGDDNIGIDFARLKTIVELIKPMDCTFRLNMSVGYMTDELAQAAREAGCTDISFGVETFSSAMLRIMKKPATRQRNIDAIVRTKRHDIRAKAYLMVNYPGESNQTVKENLEGLFEANPDRWLLSAFVPLPGSMIFHNPAEHGVRWMSDNWEDYYLVGNNGSFKPCYTTDELSLDRQLELHDVMLSGCKSIAGAP